MTVAEPDLPPPSDDPRRYPSTLGGSLYLLALLGVGVGLGIAVLGDWRVGVRWVGGALLFAAGCRLALPARQAGMLAVRRRLVDTVMLTAGGVILIFLAGDIPNQPL